MFIETLRNITQEAQEKKKRALVFWQEDDSPKDEDWIKKKTDIVIRSIYEALIAQAEQGNNSFSFHLPMNSIYAEKINALFDLAVDAHEFAIIS